MMKARTAKIQRKTLETDISVEVNLDGSGTEIIQVHREPGQASV